MALDAPAAAARSTSRSERLIRPVWIGRCRRAAHWLGSPSWSAGSKLRKRSP